jgi:hypothetical protein
LFGHISLLVPPTSAYRRPSLTSCPHSISHSRPKPAPASTTSAVGRRSTGLVRKSSIRSTWSPREASRSRPGGSRHGLPFPGPGKWLIGTPPTGCSAEVQYVQFRPFPLFDESTATSTPRQCAAPTRARIAAQAVPTAGSRAWGPSGASQRGNDTCGQETYQRGRFSPSISALRCGLTLEDPIDTLRLSRSKRKGLWSPSAMGLYDPARRAGGPSRGLVMRDPEREGRKAARAAVVQVLSGALRFTVDGEQLGPAGRVLAAHGSWYAPLAHGQRTDGDAVDTCGFVSTPQADGGTTRR